MTNTGILLAAFLFILSRMPACCGDAPARPAGELIDRVWSGHPVGFAFMEKDGRLYAAYYDERRRMTVATRPADGTERDWVRVHPEGWPLPKRNRMSNEVGWDSHNSLVMAFDKDGCLHLAGNMHVDPLIYYRADKPHDITSLKSVRKMTGENEDNCTYPVFIKNSGGDLIFRYRDGRSGSGSDIYNIYDAKTRAWRRLCDRPVLDGEKARNAYAKPPAPGPDGRFHMIWMWRDTPDVRTNHTLSYARSKDLVHWEDSGGNALATPITLRTGEIIDGAQPGEGLVNTTYALGFDAEKRPLAVYHRYDAQGRSQLYAARLENGAWVRRQLTHWDFRWDFGGGGSIIVDVSLGNVHTDPQGRIMVEYRTRLAGAGRLVLRDSDLAVLETLPPAPSPLPPPLASPQNPDMKVQTLTVSYKTKNGAAKRMLLRWETLPENRDQPRKESPAPSELRCHELQ